MLQAVSFVSLNKTKSCFIRSASSQRATWWNTAADGWLWHEMKLFGEATVCVESWCSSSLLSLLQVGDSLMGKGSSQQLEVLVSALGR